MRPSLTRNPIEARMKKTLALIVTILLSTPAHAIQPGCFVTDYTNYCHTGFFQASDCDQVNMNSFNFGYYISSMCSYLNRTELLAVVLAGQLNNCDTAFNAVEAERKALIKKLRRACGPKCKRIK